MGDRGVVPARPRPRAGPRGAASTTPGAGRWPSPARRHRAAAATPLDPAARRLRGARPRAHPAGADGAGAGHVRRARRAAAAARRTRHHGRRAAARAPERPAGGQLLGLHAAGLRRRRPAHSPPATTPPASWPRSSPPPTTTTSRCGSTSCSTTRPRSTPPGRPTACAGCRDGALLPAARRRLVHRDDGVRQRPRRHVAGRPGPRAVVARPAGRPRRRRVPVRPGRRARRTTPASSPALDRLGGGARRRDGGRAVGRRRHPPARPGVAGSRRGCSGTTASATTCAGSCAARRGSCRRWRSGCRAAPTCSTRRWRASTSSPATTGSRSTTSSPTTASTTRPTAGAARDGADHNRSWNCGWEGDDGVPADVLELRRRQLRNAWCLLAMSHGVPMAGMGDEFGRTQGGNNNAYNQDNETSWVDWERAGRVRRPRALRRELLALRHRHPVLSQAAWWGDDVQVLRRRRPGRPRRALALAGLARRRLCT